MRQTNLLRSNHENKCSLNSVFQTPASLIAAYENYRDTKCVKFCRLRAQSHIYLATELHNLHLIPPNLLMYVIVVLFVRGVEIKSAQKKNNACNKKKQPKVNVNAPRRKTRPLSWLENQQLSASDQILSWDLSPPTTDEQ